MAQKQIKTDKAGKNTIARAKKLLNSKDSETLYQLLLQEVNDCFKIQKNHNEQKKQLESRQAQLLNLQNDYQKELKQRKLFESIAIELQNHNNKLREEYKEVIEKEKQKRNQLSQDYQLKLNYISESLQGNIDERCQILQINQENKQKLKIIQEKYDLREKQFTQIMAQKNLEDQLVSIQIQERSVAVQQIQKEVQQKADEQIKQHIQAYSKKFEEYQSTIQQYNEGLKHFQSEMQTMAQIKARYEAENAFIKEKIQEMEGQLSVINDQKNQAAKQITALTKQRDNLSVQAKQLTTKKFEKTAKQ